LGVSARVELTQPLPRGPRGAEGAEGVKGKGTAAKGAAAKGEAKGAAAVDSSSRQQAREERGSGVDPSREGEKWQYRKIIKCS